MIREESIKDLKEEYNRRTLLTLETEYNEMQTDEFLRWMIEDGWTVKEIVDWIIDKYDLDDMDNLPWNLVK